MNSVLSNESLIQAVVRQYQAVLRSMIELGFHKPLDADSEVPNRLKPSESLNVFKQS